ncbi:probable membrane-associated kinase regulator 2 [Salvia miltiorrhiza]|uniref:probable membrane-associated kinase regulator 2 n=1 Tax=Salvia miltiorrhiza TaxID=226208 RepID=UPI0025AD71C4|nr:probable membrane-associated kinase regulator 2 [Salvia miltiorrhiza]
MLNYWRTSGGTAGGGGAASPFSDYGFDGPFYDLEFTLSNHSSETSLDSDEDMSEIELNLHANDQNFTPPTLSNPDQTSKLPVSLLKTAAKVGLLFKKPDSATGSLQKSEKIGRDKKLLRVKFKVDEVKGPLISLFARDYSISATNSEHLGKETLQKYLNILKPLYVRVEKMKFSGQLGFHGGGPDSPPPDMAGAGLWNNNLQAGLNVVRKHLGKSRSTSTAPEKMGSNRRDDSLLELHDGIQGAILHCKRSFNSNTERELVSVGE